MAEVPRSLIGNTPASPRDSHIVPQRCGTERPGPSPGPFLLRPRRRKQHRRSVLCLTRVILPHSTVIKADRPPGHGHYHRRHGLPERDCAASGRRRRDFVLAVKDNQPTPKEAIGHFQEHLEGNFEGRLSGANGAANASAKRFANTGGMESMHWVLRR